MSELLLSARDIEIEFTLRGKTLKAVRGASLDLYAGESLAIVGESGCGKSVFVKSMIGMLDKNGRITSGKMQYRGQELTELKDESDWLKIRGKKIAMVFQDPMTSLNPVRTIGSQLTEILDWHFHIKGAEAKREAISLLESVGIQDAANRFHQYPHEFSGGMRQRVVIACAIACRPEVLICDEPTTALDVTVQAQVLDLIKRLQKERGMTVIYITHDLGVVANVADRILVMYAGQIVEGGLSREIFYDARHPYTRALLVSLPQLGVRGHELRAIKGTPPNLYKEIHGDAFAPRNEDAMQIDFEAEPPVFQVTPTHFAKTWLLHDMAQEYASNLRKRDEQIRARQRQEQPESFDYAHAEQLVSIKNLSVTFKLNHRTFKAVDNVSFDIFKGETLSLVGESGSGKTTIGRAIMRLYPQNTKGEIIYGGRNIAGPMSRKDMRSLRQKIQMIFQDPMACLNERAKVDYIVSEGLDNYHLYASEQERADKVRKIMEEVGLNAEFILRFPHEFSGGQRQRIGIARSLVMDPEFVIADEPISALDVSIRAQVINLLNKLKKERNLTYLFIAHDLSVVRFISDRIAVIYKGKLVEMAQNDELFAHPLHPYTKALLSAVPVPDPDQERKKVLLTYDPSQHDYSKDGPEWVAISPKHFVLANHAEAEQYQRELND